MIANKHDCKKAYSHYEGMGAIIEKYMICTLASGNIDANGEQIVEGQPLAQGCITKQEKRMGREGVLVRVYNNRVLQIKLQNEKYFEGKPVISSYKQILNQSKAMY